MRTLLLLCSLLLMAGCSTTNQTPTASQKGQPAPDAKQGPANADDQPVEVADNTGGPDKTGGFTVSHPNLKYDHKIFVQTTGYQVACFEMAPKIFNTDLATAKKWSVAFNDSPTNTLATLSSKDNNRIEVDFKNTASVTASGLADGSETFTTAVVTVDNQAPVSYPRKNDSPSQPLSVRIHYCPSGGCNPNPCQ